MKFKEILSKVKPKFSGLPKDYQVDLGLWCLVAFAVLFASVCI